MTAGTFTTQHGTPPTVLPATPSAGFTGKETAKTGTLSTGTVTIPSHQNVTSEATTTIYVLQVPGTKATGTVTTTGAVSIGVTLEYKNHISALGGSVVETCVSETPVHVVLSSTARYTTTSKSVTVKNSTITVPDFAATNCGLAQKTLNAQFAGAGGEIGLTLHGTLTVPPPATPTTTALSATPASPQLTGTSVTLQATIKKSSTGELATAATGSVTFKTGTTTLGTASVSAGIASLATTKLPVGIDTVTASYSGGGGYKASTGSFTYTISPPPTVKVTGLPKTVPGASSTFHTFTATVTNPSSGVKFTEAFLELSVTGLRNPSAKLLTLEYENGTTWCPVTLTKTGTDLVGYFAGTGTGCTLTYPASFSSTPGTPLTLHLRIAFPTVSSKAFYGTAVVAATLSTGTCSSATACTAVAPLSGSAAPTGSSTPVTILPASPFATTAANEGRTTQTTVRQTFDLLLGSAVTPTLTTSFISAPVGTMTYAIDGTQVATQSLRGIAGGGEVGYTPSTDYSTASLSTGPHQLTATYTPATYTGHTIFTSSSYTFTFTVATAPTGTPFTCTAGGLGVATVSAYVTASGTVPPATLATSTKPVTVTVSDVSVTLVADPVRDASSYNTNNEGATLGFSPAGSKKATAGKITFTGTTAASTAVTGTWSGLSTAVPVGKGATPGSVLETASDSISFVAGLTSFTCEPTTADVPAPIGQTMVAGTTLSVSPSGSSYAGTAVTLTATVYPMPSTGGTTSQVQFFDGSSTSLGTALVSTTGATRGTASITVPTLAVGTHSLTAAWTGDPATSIPFNVSAAVPYTVNPTPPTPVTPPVVTTQPTSVGVKAGQTATFTAGASGTSPSVQWQESSDGGTTWSNITGATATTYSVVGTKGNNDTQYRAVFTNSAGTATTTPATLYVTAKGYRLTASNGAVFAYGNAPFYGSAGNLTLDAPIVGSASTPTGGGYWLVASDGGIFSYGNAQFYGSMGGKPLNAPIVSMAAAPTGKGYWEVASDGGIFAFGSATFSGSMGGKPLNQPVVAMAATPTGTGYCEVAADGGIFSFGTAGFYGSTGSMTLNKPIVSMVATPTGTGYWLVASDGGIFSFGTAPFYGTVAGAATSPVVGMLATSDGGGYWEVEANGQVSQFGDAALAGTALTETLGRASIVAISD